MKPDSYYSSESLLKVFNAAHHKSEVRMEQDSFYSACLHVFDGKQNISMRLDFSTLVCLAKVMDQWRASDPLAEKELGHETK